MKAQLNTIENKLASAYKDLPQLPENSKKALVNFAPWLSLAFGILSLLSAWWLYDWAKVANKLVDYANDLSRAYGVDTVASSSRFSIAVWLGLAVLAVEGVIYLMAYSGLKARKKSGWDLLFLGALINLAYGVVIAFTSYGGVGSLIGSLIGSAIGFYFLFQIRSHYSTSVARK